MCERSLRYIPIISRSQLYGKLIRSSFLMCSLTTGATHEIVLATCYETTVHIFCEQHTQPLNYTKLLIHCNFSFCLKAKFSLHDVCFMFFVLCSTERQSAGTGEWPSWCEESFWSGTQYQSISCKEYDLSGMLLKELWSFSILHKVNTLSVDWALCLDKPGYCTLM